MFRLPVGRHGRAVAPVKYALAVSMVTLLLSTAAGADTPRPGFRAAASLDPFFAWMGGHVQTGRAAGFSARLLLEGGFGEGFALGGGGELLWYTPVTRRRLTPYTGIESFGLVVVGGSSPGQRSRQPGQRSSGWYTGGGYGAMFGVQHDDGRFMDVRVAFTRVASPAVRVVYGRTWGNP